MERRLVLHEKLKNSKRFLSIKQGDVLLNLNLKTDIIDPNIEISDKVLFMLEAFADKQNGSEKTLKVADSPVEPTPVMNSSTCNLKIGDKLTSPLRWTKKRPLSKSVQTMTTLPSPVRFQQKQKYVLVFDYLILK